MSRTHRVWDNESERTRTITVRRHNKRERREMDTLLANSANDVVMTEEGDRMDSCDIADEFGECMCMRSEFHFQICFALTLLPNF